MTIEEEKKISDFEQLFEKLGIDDISDLMSSKRRKKKLGKLLPQVSLDLKNELVNCFNILHFEFLKEARSLKRLAKSPPPSSSGVYGWYFKPWELSRHIPWTECTFYTKGWWRYKTYWVLMYIGKAADLKERIIGEHFEGKLVRDKAQSSLRQTLGCLLCKQLKINLWKYPDFPKREYTFGDYGEAKLSDWMSQYAKVDWIETANAAKAAELEKEAIEFYTLPLNTEGNVNWFIEPLKGLRKGMRDCAPFLDFQASKKTVRKAYRRARKVYKNFVREYRCYEKGGT